jgi:hypothetical protein
MFKRSVWRTHIRLEKVFKWEPKKGVFIGQFPFLLEWSSIIETEDYLNGISMLSQCWKNDKTNETVLLILCGAIYKLASDFTRDGKNCFHSNFYFCRRKY